MSEQSAPWFRRNERGIGPGLPIHRNGWILLGAYVAFLILFPWPLEAWLGYPPETLERFITMLAVTIPVFVLAWKKTARETRHWSDE
jgi:hypothetical protein